jgi:hypothetical protein
LATSIVGGHHGATVNWSLTIVLGWLPYTGIATEAPLPAL